MLWKCERSIRLPLFHLSLRLCGLWDADLPRPLHRHLDALLVRNWLAGADAVVVADFLLLVPAVLLRQLDALLLGLEPALLLLVLLALRHRVAVIALDVLANLVLLLMTDLPRNDLALGLGNLLADALGLPGNWFLHWLLWPGLRLLFLLPM